MKRRTLINYVGWSGIGILFTVSGNGLLTSCQRKVSTAAKELNSSTPSQPQVATQPPQESTNVSGKQPSTTVKISNFKYEPATLTIHVGETVKFVNQDEEPHTVTAKDGSFNSKGLDTNQDWIYTFTQTGTFPYFCTIHPFMKGTITVLPHS